jgi:hypothetical protein
MEIKIKQGEEMIDATIEIIDGILVVSPKEEKFEPKDGDVVYQDGRRKWVFIYMDCLTAEAYHYVSMELPSGNISFKDGEHIGYIDTLRPATEEEKTKLFDKLKEEGLEWDANKKELVKFRWEPKVNEIYYYPSMKPQKGRVISYPKEERNTELPFDKEIIDAGWVFSTKEECQSFCDKLSQAINQIKP